MKKLSYYYLPKINLKGDKANHERINIQDDEDGHLIYVPGDVLKNRCKWPKRTIDFSGENRFL